MVAKHHAIQEVHTDQVDRVEALWKGMVVDHQEIAGDVWPVRVPDDAWGRRRRQYVEWLDSGKGRMLIAVPGDGSERADGYALLLVHPPGPTWDLGEQVGELESLAVVEGMRGEGIGSILIDACRKILREQGVEYWGVSVVEANAAATRLYERAGFRPYYRQLLGRT